MILAPSDINSGSDILKSEELPEWERVLSAAARLQTILPDAVLVEGTAAAAYARIIGNRAMRITF